MHISLTVLSGALDEQCELGVQVKLCECDV